MNPQDRNSILGVENPACRVCGKTDDLSVCSLCHVTFYCSKDHQKEDWISHKKNSCVPYKENGNEARTGWAEVAFSLPKSGRPDKKWTAKRDLLAGAIVFMDKNVGHVPQLGESEILQDGRIATPNELISTKFPYTHSCRPNCRFDLFKNPQLVRNMQNLSLRDLDSNSAVLVVRTIVPVKKGEILTVGGNLRYPHIGTHYRREIMRDHDQVICTCARCQDPTEFNSFTSAVNCQSCLEKSKEAGETDPEKYGYFLPMDPLNFSKTAPWKCTKCEVKKPASEVLVPVKKMYDYLVQRGYGGRPLLGNVDVEQHLESLVDKLKDVVHPNHWLFTKIIAFMSYPYDVRSIKVNSKNLPVDMTDFERRRLEKFIQRTEYILNVEDKRAPGWTFQKGEKLWEYWRAKFLLANRLRVDEMTIDEIKNAVEGSKEALEIFNETVTIRRFEFCPISGRAFWEFECRDTDFCKTKTIAQFNAKAKEILENIQNRIEYLENLLKKRREQN